MSGKTDNHTYSEYKIMYSDDKLTGIYSDDEKKKNCETHCELICLFDSKCHESGWEDADANSKGPTDTGDHEVFP